MRQYEEEDEQQDETAALGEGEHQQQTKNEVKTLETE